MNKREREQKFAFVFYIYRGFRVLHKVRFIYNGRVLVRSDVGKDRDVNSKGSSMGMEVTLLE